MSSINTNYAAMLAAQNVNATTEMLGGVLPRIAPVLMFSSAKHNWAISVIALTGSASRLVHMPLPSDDPRQRRPDISLAGRLLDWKPAIELDEGLSRTIAYFDNLLAGERRGV